MDAAGEIYIQVHVRYILLLLRMVVPWCFPSDFLPITPQELGQVSQSHIIWASEKALLKEKKTIWQRIVRQSKAALCFPSSHGEAIGAQTYLWKSTALL